MYGNIISENANNIKGQEIFFTVYRLADKTIGEKTVSSVTVGTEYAGWIVKG